MERVRSEWTASVVRSTETAHFLLDSWGQVTARPGTTCDPTTDTQRYDALKRRASTWQPRATFHAVRQAELAKEANGPYYQWTRNKTASVSPSSKPSVSGSRTADS